MVKIRLKRTGKKKKPVYKIVAADSRSPRDGRNIEELGYYDPNFDPIKFSIKIERLKYWLNNGAVPTETVNSLLKREGIKYRLYLERKGKTEEEIKDALQKFQLAKEYRENKRKEKKKKLAEKRRKTKKEEGNKAQGEQETKT
ncbi:MAG: 30S ribosomal protein S16 [Ignavibacteria bacterium]|nr:30S ribosomal protein S16 [Ignavibacteria bacterium]